MYFISQFASYSEIVDKFARLNCLILENLYEGRTKRHHGDRAFLSPWWLGEDPQPGRAAILQKTFETFVYLLRLAQWSLIR